MDERWPGPLEALVQSSALKKKEGGRVGVQTITKPKESLES